MARIGFGLASFASLAFLIWLSVTELESPGLSFAVALIGMSLLVTLFGFFKIKGNALTKDARNAGWAALGFVVLACGYMLTFFASWIPIVIGWLALHISMVIALMSSQTAADE